MISAGLLVLLFASQPMRVGGDVRAPVALTQPKFDFGQCLKKKETIGLPIIESVIDETGRVESAHLLKPLAPCAERVALNGVKKMRFRPATYKGKPVRALFTMTIHIDYR